MRVQFYRSMNKSKRLRGKMLWLCALTCLCVPGISLRSFAQVGPVPSTSTGQLGISPEEPVAPPEPIVIRVPAPSATEPARQDAGQKGHQVTMPDSRDRQDMQPARVAVPAIPDPDPNNPVAVQSASLLKMAYDLRSEVDKTTKDMLSVTVVRRASEIEQLARKMRSK